MFKLQLSLYCLLAISCSSKAQQGSENIRINQLGYFPLAPKLAIVTTAVEGNTFYLTAVNAADTLFKGELSAEMHSKNSSLVTRVADFTSFLKPGIYVLHVGLADSSFPFAIGENVIKQVAVSSLKGFYYQRVSMPLEEKYAGKWARPAGHPDNEVLIHPSAATDQRPAGTMISSPGGWYDAGDYNKYIVNSGITMGTLFSAYEDFPEYFKKLVTNIPESTDAVPDILNEILYNLRWMFTMQDPNDGGVYNKCTNAAFDAIIMPDKAVAERWVVQKGTAATLDYAAVMAQASRILKAFPKQLPGLSDSCLKAAVYAWDWVQKNPAVEYNQNAMNKMLNKPAISTGGYGDKNFFDEWLWAAAELYISTSDESYYKFITKNVNSKLTLPSWNNVYAPGFYSLIRHEKTVGLKHAEDIKKIKRNITELADSYLEPVKDNAFKTVMGGARSDFNWGSNSNAANQGILFLNAWQITKDRKYADAALTNLDYLLGRNATGFCFVTGAGSKSTMHPHHRPSMADGIEEPVPGLLAGGPNPGKQDNCTYAFSDPETCYADIDCSYSTNEIAINWNAPLVYLANAFEALQYELGYSVTKKK